MMPNRDSLCLGPTWHLTPFGHWELACVTRCILNLFEWFSKVSWFHWTMLKNASVVSVFKIYTKKSCNCIFVSKIYMCPVNCLYIQNEFSRLMLFVKNVKRMRDFTLNYEIAPSWRNAPCCYPWFAGWQDVRFSPSILAMNLWRSCVQFYGGLVSQRLYDRICVLLTRLSTSVPREILLTKLTFI